MWWILAAIVGLIVLKKGASANAPETAQETPLMGRSTFVFTGLPFKSNPARGVPLGVFGGNAIATSGPSFLQPISGITGAPAPGAPAPGATGGGGGTSGVAAPTGTGTGGTGFSKLISIGQPLTGL